MSVRRAVLLLLVVALAVPAMADVRVRIVRLSYLDGDVQIDRRDGEGFERAMTNMPVVQGTRLWAREEGRAEIELEDGSTLRLTPNSMLEAQEMALRGGKTVNLFDLQEGTAYFNIHGDDDDNFLLTLPGTQLRLRKGSRFRVTAQRNEVRVAVFKGEVELSGAGVHNVAVRKGESISLDPFEGGRYFLSRDVSSEYYDSWDEEREDYRETYARHNAYRGYSDYYRYGAHDLHYWGNYSYVSGWGWIWRPFYVGAAWHPWHDGAWVWYPGWGYTWVSAYPWGWMPYHFGSWVWIPTYGWGWQPGGGWSWRHYTVARHRPHGFFNPAPPRRGGGRVVIVGDGGRTVYPRDERRGGFLGTVRDGRNANQGAPLGGHGKGAGDSATTPGGRLGDGRGGSQRGDRGTGLGGSNGRAGDRDTGARFGEPGKDADDGGRGGRYTPPAGRTVMDSRPDDDDRGRDRDTERRIAPMPPAGSGSGSGSGDTGRGSGYSGRSGSGDANRGSGSSGRSGGTDSGRVGGSSGRSGDMDSGRSGSRSGGGQDPPPARVSPPPARESSPPPARDSSPRSTSSRMSFSGGRSSSPGAVRSSGPSASSGGSSRSSGSRTSSRSPR